MSKKKEELIIAQDRSGKLLKVGDRCFAELTVIEIQPAGVYTNLVCTPTQPNPGAGSGQRVGILAVQVEKAPTTQRTLHFVGRSTDNPLNELRTTVRRGHKWVDASGILTLCYDDPSGSGAGRHCETGKAEIVSTRLTVFSKMTNTEIERTDVQSARLAKSTAYNIIRNQMRENYPGFHEDEIVTVITYKRIS
jgi:hypothetical protein